MVYACAAAHLKNRGFGPNYALNPVQNAQSSQAFAWVAVMYDPNLQDFYKRVDRIKSGHSKGARFVARDEATGKTRQRRGGISGVRFLAILLFVGLAVFGMKGAIHAHVGAATYADRLADMEARGGFDQFGAVLMTLDPLSLWVSEHLQIWLPRLL
jgi:hypothetical protein